MQDSQWPAAAFALGLLIAITAITVAAIWKYDTVDDALKFWAVLSGLIGVVIGAAATHFFTRSAVAAAGNAASEAATAATAAQTAAAGAASAASAADTAATGAADAATAAQQTRDATQRQLEELTTTVRTLRG